MTAPDLAPARSAASAPKVGFVSLGCPKALTDSELILTQLSAEGYQTSKTFDGADLNEGYSAIVLTPETRLWMRPDNTQIPIDMFGVGYDELLLWTEDGWKSHTEMGFPEPDWEKLEP